MSNENNSQERIDSNNQVHLQRESTQNLTGISEEIKRLRESLNSLKNENRFTENEINEISMNLSKEEEEESIHEKLKKGINSLERRDQSIRLSKEIKNNYIEKKLEEFKSPNSINPRMFQSMKKYTESNQHQMSENEKNFYHDLIMCSCLEIMEEVGIDKEKFIDSSFIELKNKIYNNELSFRELKSFLKTKEDRNK